MLATAGRTPRCYDLTRSQQPGRSEEHTSELQSLRHLVCRLLLEKKKKQDKAQANHGQEEDDAARIRPDQQKEAALPAADREETPAYYCTRPPRAAPARADAVHRL